jgi:hypothetical protein
MIAVFLGFVLSRVIMEVFHTIDIFDRVFRTLPIFQDWPFFINQYTIMWLALALFLAYRRLK